MHSRCKLLRLAHKQQEIRGLKVDSNKITLTTLICFPFFSAILQAVWQRFIYYFNIYKLLIEFAKFILTLLNEFKTRLMNACKQKGSKLMQKSTYPKATTSLHTDL